MARRAMHALGAHEQPRPRVAKERLREELLPHHARPRGRPGSDVGANLDAGPVEGDQGGGLPRGAAAKPALSKLLVLYYRFDCSSLRS